MEMNDSMKLVNQDPKQHDKAIKLTEECFKSLGISSKLPQNTTSHDFFSQLLGSSLSGYQLIVDTISRGRITCSFTALPYFANIFNGLHGGAVVSIAERLAIACARTIVAEEKPLFLGELRVSYLSATPVNAKLIAEGSVVRTGKNLTVVSIEFREKENKKLVYTAQATFFNLPVSKL